MLRSWLCVRVCITHARHQMLLANLSKYHTDRASAVVLLACHQLMLDTGCSSQAHGAIPLTQQAPYGLTFHQPWHHAGVQFWACPLAKIIAFQLCSTVPLGQHEQHPILDAADVVLLVIIINIRS